MQKTDCFELGFISRTHGIDGGVVAQLDTDKPQHYANLDAVFLDQNGQLVPYFIEHIRLNLAQAILNLDGVNSLAAAEALVGSSLWLPLSALPTLPEGKYYFHEIIGFRVVDTLHGELGTVASIYSGPMQDLIAMSYEGAEVLIPLVDSIVLRADKTEQVLHTQLPEGLLEVYLSPADQEPDDADED